MKADFLQAALAHPPDARSVFGSLGFLFDAGDEGNVDEVHEIARLGVNDQNISILAKPGEVRMRNIELPLLGHMDAEGCKWCGTQEFFDLAAGHDRELTL